MLLFRRKQKVLSFEEERAKYPLLYRRELGVHRSGDRIIGTVGCRGHEGRLVQRHLQ